MGANMKYDNICMSKETSLKDAMKLLDVTESGIILITKENKELLGVMTAGDIRKAILNGANSDSIVENIMNKNPISVEKGKEEELCQNLERIKKLPEREPIRVPVLDENRKVIDMISLIIHDNKKVKKSEENNSIKKVLVIGGAGYLGSVLIRKLLDKNCKVKVLDNLTYGDSSIKELYNHKNFEFYEGDIRNIHKLMESIKGVDAVIHLASIVGDPAGSINPQTTLESNYFATKILVDICKHNQINRFIFASTCSVYGAMGFEETIDETSELNPVSLYAETKIKSEQAILKAVDSNFSPTIFRMATLYGVSPRMRFDLVINLLTAKALSEKEITIFGGNQWRPFLDVEDASEAYIKCLEAPIEKISGEIFNIGGNENNYKLIEIGKKIKQLVPDANLNIDENMQDRRNYRVSCNKAENLLGFRPKKSVEEGIKEIIEAMNKKEIVNYKDEKYNNYEFLNKMLDKF